MQVKTLKWVGGVDGFLRLIDQRRLPGEVAYIECRDVDTLVEAIKTLAVRGAPAIGAAAGFGLVLAIQNVKDDASTGEVMAVLEAAKDKLAASRPTAVNLFWALERVFKAAQGTRGESIKSAVLCEARAIFDEDVEMCRRIGENGAGIIKDGMNVLTHCNAGALATAGSGTALAVFYEAKNRGVKFKVYADETRPLLQGARLTAWELSQAGVDVTVICDNMAGWLMRQGKVDAVMTGADRIAANGDSANKIGTYSLSVLAKHHGIPFYIAAPTSTFDLSIPDGSHIPIEQRGEGEIRTCGSSTVVPAEAKVYNPAFDVTPAENITAIITECGMFAPCRIEAMLGIKNQNQEV
ncbi:MAG: S-methyl-5-thioribose-1-phosphate isomerase [Planctomycetes bacterium GWF2_50_10]|nr:MAG: S-methyl-5-thioribose-1-phosphate isomerase [Planctomycetes bacterium GWF2_50_10]